ncbi:GNAT family N-acetyltransferase [Candidatus Bathyarchaeota archaeon]|nr:GNAT family N-acetyltransferase [Candidatus Bathyarchaeota archaeon]
MVDVRIVPYDEEEHREDIYNLYYEYAKWTKQAVEEKYGIVYENVVGGKIEDLLENVLKVFTSLKPPKGIIMVLEVDGVPAGIGRLSKIKDNIAEINNMFISLEYRGFGYGKAVLNSLEDKAREFGYTTLRLDTGAHNVAAQHLYRKAGYLERDYYGSPYGRAAKDTIRDGKIYYDNKLYFEKQL